MQQTIRNSAQFRRSNLKMLWLRFSACYGFDKSRDIYFRNILCLHVLRTIIYISYCIIRDEYMGGGGGGLLTAGPPVSISGVLMEILYFKTSQDSHNCRDTVCPKKFVLFYTVTYYIQYRSRLLEIQYLKIRSWFHKRT